MVTKQFTHTDYFSATLSRCEDLRHLRTNPKSIIFSLYCAGVTIECMLRAYIAKYTSEFDSKHDLEKLYEKSRIASTLETAEKEALAIAIKKANKVWTNNLRYTSDKRMKRLMAHEKVRTEFKDIHKYIDKYYSDIFDATDLIIKTGQDKWI